MTSPDLAFERRLRAPIFLACLSRGGSNILWNLFLSHPDVCSPIRETLQIFRLDHRAPTLRGLYCALLSRQPRFFDQWKLAPRRPLGRRAARYVDRVLHGEKLRTLDDAEMCWKRPGERYTREEVERARLVAKNNNGLVFLTPELRRIYPDATFFALVRDPLALWESHRRRRLHASVRDFAAFYAAVVGRMLDDEERDPRYRLVRFEDVLRAPLDVVRRLYAAADLDFAAIDHLRFKSKEHFRADGSRGADWEVGRHHWFELAAVHRFLEPRVNEIQTDRVAAEERRVVLEHTAGLRRRLGYAD